MTPRAVVLGLVGVVALSLFTPYSDLVLRGTWLGLTAFPISALLGLLLLLLVRILGSRLGLRLRPAELLTAYALMLVAAGIPSFGLTGLLVPFAAGPNYFATPENRFAESLVALLPRWMLFSPEVATAFYEGLPPGRHLPWAMWLAPAIGWGLLIAGVYLLLFAVAALIRRPWIDQERLVFPLMQLPIALAEDDGRRWGVPPLLRDPVTWMFFAVPFLAHAVNGLHQHFPVVPALKFGNIDLGGMLSGRYAEAVKPLWLRGLFMVVGLTYLLPSEIGFSLWFFYVFFLVQQLLAVHLGFTIPFVQAYPVHRFVALQMIGGVIVTGGYLLWSARGPLLAYLGDALAGRQRPNEAMAPRALLGALVGGLLLVGAWGQITGGSAGWVIGLVTLFLLYQLVGTRLVAEGGMLFVQHPHRPINLVLSLWGTAGPGRQRLPALTLLDHLFMLDNRSPLQPAVLQGLKLADAGGFSPRSLMRWMGVAVVLAVPLSLISYIALMLRHGGTTLHPWFTSYYTSTLWGTWTTHLVINGEAATLNDLNWIGTGSLTMILLWSLHRLMWRWPLHPIGYLMGASYPMIVFWFPVLVGWLLKTLTLRYGGARLYRRLMPGFLALILGEYAAAGLWTLIDALAGVPGHEVVAF